MNMRRTDMDLDFSMNSEMEGYFMGEKLGD